MMQNFENRRSVQKWAQYAGSNVLNIRNGFKFWGKQGVSHQWALAHSSLVYMYQASFRILVLQYFAFGVKNVIFLHLANKVNILSNDEREILNESIAYFWYLLNAIQQCVKYIKRFRKAQNKPLFNTDGIHVFSEIYTICNKIPPYITCLYLCCIHLWWRYLDMNNM